MAAQPTYDAIVVGAGVEGSACAYTLAKAGKKVLLLEQFPLPHSRGSSHGQSRITRYAYRQDFYVRMMVDAFPLWAELAAEVDEELFVNCGVLDLRSCGSPGLRDVTEALSKFNIPHENLSASEVRKRFPAIKLQDNERGVFDPNGGILKADRAVNAFQTVFKGKGGVIRDGEPVLSVTPGDCVTVKTTKGVYVAPSLVIAAGPWAGRFTKSLGLDLPLKPVRITVMYWKAKEGHVVDHSAEFFPCIVDSRSGEDLFHTYELPIDEYPGLFKACLHSGPDCDPDHRDRNQEDGWVQDKVLDVVASTFPHLEHTPSIKEYCMYTFTPDSHPFIDRHPDHSNIIIAAGFSGHGFKLAPAVSKAVSELVLNKKPSYNMKPFRIDRFSPKSNL